MIIDIPGDPEDVEIAFRLFKDDSHAPFFADRKDIRCSNWQQFDISQPQEKKEAENHIICLSKPTNYISISTSPRRIWNLAIKNHDRVDQKIAVLDLRVLRRLGIAYGSSTDDLGFEHLNKTNGTGTMFATKHHILVLGWLPPCCILGFLSIKQFEALLEQAQIDNSSSGLSSFLHAYAMTDLGNAGNISILEYEKKIGFSSILQHLS